MPTYKVLEPGFFEGTYRVPGGQHDPVVTDKKLDPVPSWLKPVADEHPSKAESKKKTAEEKKAAVNQQKEEVKGASFMDGGQKSGGVETL